MRRSRRTDGSRGVSSRADLERFYLLDDADEALTGDRRGDHNRLGFVLQATTARYLGRVPGGSAGRAVACGGVPGRAAWDWPMPRA